MRSVNKVILIGNLTRDPEMRQTPNGQYITTFGLATNRDWVTSDSKRHSLPEFHDLVAWAKLAEICNQYLKKGKLIYVEGYLKTRSWDTPEGIRKFKTEIVVQDMIMLDKRTGGVSESDYIPQEEKMLMENQQMTDFTPESPENDDVSANGSLSAHESRPAPRKRAAAARPAISKAPKEENMSAPLSANVQTPSPQNISIDEDLGL